MFPPPLLSVSTAFLVSTLHSASCYALFLLHILSTYWTPCKPSVPRLPLFIAVGAADFTEDLGNGVRACVRACMCVCVCVFPRTVVTK